MHARKELNVESGAVTNLGSATLGETTELSCGIRWKAVKRRLLRLDRLQFRADQVQPVEDAVVMPISALPR